jgi:hypothetical protein
MTKPIAGCLGLNGAIQNFDFKEFSIGQDDSAPIVLNASKRHITGLRFWKRVDDLSVTDAKEQLRVVRTCVQPDRPR